jgi:hypothetical protein
MFKILADVEITDQSAHGVIARTGDSVSEHYTPFFPFEGGRIRKVETTTGEDATSTRAGPDGGALA